MNGRKLLDKKKIANSCSFGAIYSKSGQDVSEEPNRTNPPVQVDSPRRNRAHTHTENTPRTREKH